MEKVQRLCACMFGGKRGQRKKTSEEILTDLGLFYVGHRRVWEGQIEPFKMVDGLSRPFPTEIPNPGPWEMEEN